MTESINKEEVCEFCGGTGFLTVSSQVYPGESAMAPVGWQKCICQEESNEDVELLD